MKNFSKKTHERHETHETHIVALYMFLSFFILRKQMKKLKIFPSIHESHETHETHVTLVSQVFCNINKIMLKCHCEESRIFMLVRELEFPNPPRVGRQDSARGEKIQFPPEQEGFSTVPSGWTFSSIVKLGMVERILSSSTVDFWFFFPTLIFGTSKIQATFDNWS